MKIGLVILHADAWRGGAERYTLDLARALIERGHAVWLIASSFGKEIPAEARQVLLNLTATTKTARYVQFLDQLDRHLETQACDVVHAMLPVRECDVYHPHAGIAAAAVEEGHEKHGGIARPVAKLLNRLNPRRQKFAAVERELLSGASTPRVICLSDYIRQAVRKYYTLDESHLVTLINGVDLSRFDPNLRPDARDTMRRGLGLRDDDVAALIVAQDFERKGIRESIVGMAQAKCEKLRLVIVGKDDAGPYERLARSLSLEARVSFAGPSSDVYAHYRGADFFLLPTRHDPCSLVVLEALAMGLPVISTRQNGATEVMENGVDGFVIDDASRIDKLAGAMRQLCDASIRARMSAACLARRERLSFQTHVDGLMDIYQSATQSRAASQ